MIQGNLDTTNLLLGIMAAVSVLEAIVIIALGVFAYRAYAKVVSLVEDIEQRHVAPLVARANAIMDDVKEVTERVSEQTGRVDHAIRSTIDRVDDTADRVKTNVRLKASRAIGVVRGIRAAIEAFLAGGSRTRPSAEASGRL